MMVCLCVHVLQSVSMDQLLADLQIDVRQVRWNEASGDFE